MKRATVGFAALAAVTILASAAAAAGDSAPDAPSCYDFAAVGAVTDQRYIDTPEVASGDIAWSSRYGWEVEVTAAVAGEQPPQRFRAIATHHAQFLPRGMQSVLMFVRRIDGADVIIYFDRDPADDVARQVRGLIRANGLRRCGPADRTIKAYITP
ncbi:MAG: hypothetical protein JWP35_3272 [Caulobacter sp.]|nr:hypothetical protein [Caulobacter sp.]